MFALLIQNHSTGHFPVKPKFNSQPWGMADSTLCIHWIRLVKGGNQRKGQLTSAKRFTQLHSFKWGAKEKWRAREKL